MAAASSIRAPMLARISRATGVGSVPTVRCCPRTVPTVRYWPLMTKKDHSSFQKGPVERSCWLRHGGAELCGLLCLIVIAFLTFKDEASALSVEFGTKPNIFRLKNIGELYK